MIHVPASIFQEHKFKENIRKINDKSLAFFAGLFYNSNTIIFETQKLLLSEGRRYMDYKQFLETVEKKVRENMGTHIRVSTRTVKKNNGTERSGLLIEDDSTNISPTIYLEEYYQQFLSGKGVDKIAKEVADLYEDLKVDRPWDEQKLGEYDKIKEKVIYRLIGREANEELLQEVPYVPYLDLAIIFCVLFEAGDYGMATMMIRNRHLKLWHVTKEDIYHQARYNTWHELPGEFLTMSDLIAELTGIKEKCPEEPMYVLTNQIRNYGASAILYPDRLAGISLCLKENFYVVPSSVHEMIIVPESASPGRRMLTEMLREVNETQVPDEDILSDHVYYYDRKERRLRL